MAENEGRMPATTPNYELLHLDMLPLLNRCQELTPLQEQILRKAWDRELPPVSGFEWPNATRLGEILTAIESDRAIAPDEGHADMPMLLAVAEKMRELEPRLRQMVRTAAANYGVPHTNSKLNTKGQCTTVLWIADNMPEHWFPEATEVEAEKTFEERVVEREAEVTGELAKAEGVAYLDEYRKKEHPDAPADYIDAVPLGSWTKLDEWINDIPTRNRTDAEQAEAKAERAHRVMIAEIRRRDTKQRKTVMANTAKYIPDGWLAPYLRGDAPPLPVHTVPEGKQLHVVYSTDGVRYWMEGA